jgi:hypothetical protein
MIMHNLFDNFVKVSPVYVLVSVSHILAYKTQDSLVLYHRYNPAETTLLFQIMCEMDQPEM